MKIYFHYIKERINGNYTHNCHIYYFMIKNVKLKKFLKKTIFVPLTVLNKLLPKKENIILLYSANKGIEHNLKPLKDKLIQDKYTEKYKIICAVEDKKYFEKEANIKYVTDFVAIFFFLITKHIFYTTGQIPIKPSKKQIVIHMNHGTSDLKACGALSNIGNGDEFYFTYMLAPSKLYIPIFAKEYQCNEDNILVCGEPMTDALFNKRVSYNLNKSMKKVLWLPTFRQSEYLNYSDSKEELLPMFKMEEYSELNNKLKDNNIFLIVKLHSAQDVCDLTEKKYTNIQIYTNSQFEKCGYDIYELMPQVDALIGDYSSASLQFLLLNKPLAFVVPDMEEYAKNRGFCFENPEKYMPGPIIKEKYQLYKFFEDLSKNIDYYENERLFVRNQIFKYQDGNNTNRVLKISNINL